MKFADDTKLFRKTKQIGDKPNLQDDIDKLVKWSEKWQMLFNFGKCKCLHTGPGSVIFFSTLVPGSANFQLSRLAGLS